MLGIDVGISLLMAENARSQFIWEVFMRNPEARQGMEKAGFTPLREAPALYAVNQAAADVGTGKISSAALRKAAGEL